MARRKDRRGFVETVLERSDILLERLCTGLAFSLAFIVSWVASLLACLFAAEVAVGRRITKRDPLPVRYRPEQSPAENPAPLNTAAGRGVEIFGPSSGPCPDIGARAAGHRARKRAYGYFRCIHFPACRHRRMPSRISNVSVQDWLKFNQSSDFQPPQRRPRGS